MQFFQDNQKGINALCSNCYYIHGIIKVQINRNVKNSIVAAVDSNIAYFRSKEEDVSCQKIIVIRPYDEFPIKLDSGSYIDGENSFIPENNSWVRPEQHLIFQRTSNGFNIFADSPSFLINLFIQMLLSEYGISMVHAGAVEDGHGNVFLFPALGGVGKTALVGGLVLRHNYRLLGDDIVLISDRGNCLSFPRSFFLKEYHREVFPDLFRRLNLSDFKYRISNKAKELLKHNLPFMGISRSFLRKQRLKGNAWAVLSPRAYLARIPITEIFGSESVVDSGFLRQCMFLQRYSERKFQVIPLNYKEMLIRLFSILHHEWSLHLKEMLTMGGFGLIDPIEYFNRVSSIISNAIDGKSCSILLIPKDASPQNLIDYFLSYKSKNIC